MLETVIILSQVGVEAVRHLVFVVATDWANRQSFAHHAGYISQEELISQMNDALSLPGLANSLDDAIKGRIGEC